MASTKLERIGTIFSRVTSLILGGTMKKENTPLWYELYKAFPPKYEPRFDRPPSEKPIRNIFFAEDLIRAKFHKDVKFLPAINLNSKNNSRTQKFLNLYFKHHQAGLQESEAYEKAMEEYNVMFQSEKRKQDQSTGPINNITQQKTFGTNV